MLRISRSVSVAARGSIGKRDDLIPGQECSKRQRSSSQSSVEGAAIAQRRGNFSDAGATQSLLE